MQIHARLLSNLYTVFPESAPDAELTRDTIARNEVYSFQLAYTIEGTKENAESVVMSIDSDIPVNVREIEYVPVLRPSYGKTDDWFLNDKRPGLYPDPLVPVKYECLRGICGTWKSLWFTVNADMDALSSGEHEITVKLSLVPDPENVVEKKLTLNVLPASLPKQTVLATNWLHCDCIAIAEKCKPFSAKFWDELRKYVTIAAKNGQNLVLTPMFTPPLDTPIGGERMTVQLVQIEKTESGYKFDFSLAEKFIDLCLECGMANFEHSHLFTQWGAYNAPKIVARVNGKLKKIFGWKTDAAGEEYQNFLHEYLTELKKFIKSKGLEKHFIFHVSDEPKESQIESYAAAVNLVHRELEGCLIGDALSDYKFYENGLVNMPIPVTNTVHDFIGKADPLWVYFTGACSANYRTNRLIGMTAVRNRILGTLMYYYKIQGFLQWGFNFWFNRLSEKPYDPYRMPDADQYFVGGTSYLVYPGAIESMRLHYFRDAMQDIRMLKLLESYAGFDYVHDLIEKYFPGIRFDYRPISETEFEAFCNAVTEEIAKFTK